jgi:formylglycine-generating enzyme required for sulfatase activity
MEASAHQGEETEKAASTAKPTAAPTSTEASVSQLLETYECTRCHRVTSPHRLIGPSLWQIGKRADAAAIRASIVTPDAIVTPGYPAGLMRVRLEELGFYDDIARQPAILERLVAYLSGQPEPQPIIDHPPSDLQTTIPVPSGTVSQSPEQSVEVPTFRIDAHPVTQAQYAMFIANGGYTTKRYWDRAGWAVVVKRRQRTQPNGWDADHVSDTPVVGVSMYEAQAYCHWAGQELPSELQWQHACQEAPAWHGATIGASPLWEWTIEAVWKGGQAQAETGKADCTARVPSHPALDSRVTGFRCRAVVQAASPALSSTSQPRQP